jgi:photosystem II stability/assembly factor-like uncharacterized protein
MPEIRDDPLTLCVATGDAFARIESDSEDRWSAALTLTGRSVQCIAVDPCDGATVFAGTRGSGVWKSRDGGREWERLSFTQEDVFSLAISPVDGAVYAGTEPSHLFVSRDGGDTWHEQPTLRDLPSAPDWSFPPRPSTSHVRWIAPCPHEAARLLVGIELGGLMLSEDGGDSWADHRPGAQKDVHTLAWHPQVRGRAYEAGGGGAAWSKDGGTSWTAADAGRKHDYCWGLAVHPDDPETWFVSAAPGPRDAHDADRSAKAVIYRWRADGPWQQVTDRLDSFPYAMTMAEGRIFAGLGDGRILFSNDEGDTWGELKCGGDRIDRVRALIAV